MKPRFSPQCLMVALVLSVSTPFYGGWVWAQVLGVIADYGVAEESEADVSDLVHSWNPEAVISAGDNCYAPGDFESNVDPYYGDFVDAGAFFPSIGNHDVDDGGGLDAYQAYFGVSRYYDVVVGSVHAFILNSEPFEPDGITADSAQAEWLRLGLSQSDSPWKLVIIHRPPFSSGVEHGSHPDLQWPFKEWGAHAVLSGDDHLYERLLIDDLPYFVVGLGGAVIHGFGSSIAGSEVQYNDDHGAMRIDAGASAITFEFYNRSGDLIDSYTLEAGVL